MRACNHELTDMVLDQGFIPYKTPLWSVDNLLKRMYPGTYELMQSIHALLDPDGIMNPGRWKLGKKR